MTKNCHDIWLGSEARGAAQPAAIMGALAAALQLEFGPDSGRTTMQAIVFAAQKQGFRRGQEPPEKVR